MLLEPHLRELHANAEQHLMTCPDADLPAARAAWKQAKTLAGYLAGTQETLDKLALEARQS